MIETTTLVATKLPDSDARRRLAALVGLDAVRDHLRRSIGLALRPSELNAWADRHPDAALAVDLIKRRPPLFILGGDVGTGKTELAETIGDAVGRDLEIDIHLYRLGLSARGGGLVGEMTRLLGATFGQIVRDATGWKGRNGLAGAGAILFIDEADALAQSREAQQMHHEDRAGVNALIRGIDDVGRERLPVVVLMATNRLSALDPAIRRRAARSYEFERPNDEQRATLLKRIFPALEKSPHLAEIVAVTGAREGRGYACTYSDIVQRVVPEAVLLAFPDRRLTPEILLQAARATAATPPFREP